MGELEAAGWVEIVEGQLEPYWTPHTRFGPQLESDGHWNVGPFVLRIPEGRRVADRFTTLGEKLAALEGETFLEAWLRKANEPVYVHPSASDAPAEVMFEAERLCWEVDGLPRDVVKAPLPRHVEAAVEGVAETWGLSRDTVSEYELTKDLRVAAKEARDDYIGHLLRTTDLTQAEIKELVRPTSLSHIGRVKRNGHGRRIQTRNDAEEE